MTPPVAAQKAQGKPKPKTLPNPPEFYIYCAQAEHESAR